MPPRRVDFECKGNVPQDIWRANILHSLSLGLPRVEDEVLTLKRGPLAVVGGGPSIKDHLLELRHHWIGNPLWGINGMAGWLSCQGIPAWYFSIDPVPCTSREVQDVPGAIVATNVDRSVFDKLLPKPIKLFHFWNDEGLPKGWQHGPTSACTAAIVAVRFVGHLRVELFGCEGSLGNNTHAYKHEDRNDLMRVLAAGQEWYTTPDFMLQSQFLAQLITGLPEVYINRSGGLLAAMLEDPNWRVTWLAPSIADTPALKEEAHAA